jgi:hypothetical protein
MEYKQRPNLEFEDPELTNKNPKALTYQSLAKVSLET